MFLLWVEVKKYTEDYNKMILDLYKFGMTISEISSEYIIAKSTINGWVKDNKEIKISEDEIIILKELSKLKKKWIELKRKIKYYSEAKALAKKDMSILAKEK